MCHEIEEEYEISAISHVYVLRNSAKSATVAFSVAARFEFKESPAINQPVQFRVRLTSDCEITGPERGRKGKKGEERDTE